MSSSQPSFPLPCAHELELIHPEDFLALALAARYYRADFWLLSGTACPNLDGAGKCATTERNNSLLEVQR